MYFYLFIYCYCWYSLKKKICHLILHLLIQYWVRCFFKKSCKTYENTFKSPKSTDCFTFSKTVQCTAESLQGWFWLPGSVFDTPALTSRSYVNQFVARLKVYRGSCPPSPVVINKYHLLFIVSGLTIAAKHFQCLRDLKLDGKAVLFTHLKNVILRKKPHSLQLLDSLLAKKECGLTDVSHWAV